MQPLGYQQQNSSCWITSIMNGLLYLLGSADKIPNEIARILYVLSSKNGTHTEDAKKIIHFLNAYDIKVRLEMLEGEKVTQKTVKKLLEKGVIIADIEQNEHSVLITEFNNKKFKIFDPDWNTIKRGLSRKTPGEEFTTSEKFFNVEVDEESLFKKHSKGKIRLCGKKSREIIAMKTT